jgi:beta-fructofuranosidase
MLLFFSHKRCAQYYVGEYDSEGHRFTPDYHGRMNYGPFCVGSLHAPSATVDEDGRFLAIFNVKEGKPSREWSDIMSLPRHLFLREDNSLRIEPVEEIKHLRGPQSTVEPADIPANSEVLLPGVQGNTIEIETVLEPGSARQVGLDVLRSPDAEEYTRISLFKDNHRHFQTSSLQIDVTSSSLRHDVFARTAETGPLTLEEGERLRLRIFVDRSIVEVFANGRQCLTVRVYPEREDSRGVALFARGSSARLVSLKAWQMEPL